MKKRLLIYPLLVSALFACKDNSPEKDSGQETSPSEVVPLAKQTNDVSSVRISQDGMKVYFAASISTSATAGSRSTIFVINHDGTGEQKLLATDGLVTNLVENTVSKRLAFTNNISLSNEFQTEMYVTDFQGKVEYKMEHDIRYKTTPYFILNSGNILFNKHGNYSGECSCNTIWSLDMATRTDRKLNDKTELVPTQDARLADITPDEKTILFTNVLKGTYTMGIDGNGLRKLDGALTPIAISPDSKTVLAQRSVTNASGRTSFQIFTLNLDGSNLKQITAFEGNSIPVAFSPDGKRILFSSDKDQSGKPSTELYLMNVDGSGVIRLTDNNQNEEAYGFMNGGKSILFASKLTGPKLLYVLKNFPQ